MTKENLEDLSTERLIKRRKSATVLLVILIVAAVLDMAVLVYDLIMGNGVNITLITPAIACLVIAIPIYMGLRKIIEESAKRNDG